MKTLQTTAFFLLLVQSSYAQDFYDLKYELLTYEVSIDTSKAMISEEIEEWTEYCQKKNGKFISKWKRIDNINYSQIFGAICKYQTVIND